MKHLQTRLEEAGVWDERLGLEIAALWKYGVDAIGDEELRAAVGDFLCVVPKIFFTDHASRSGRFHPPWQNGRHGTLRSIIESCVVLPGFARHVPEILDERMEPDPRALDVALAATIVSDVWKKEDAGDIHYGAAHGRVAAERWTAFATARGLDPRVVRDVADGSFWHFGVYTPEWTRGTALSPVARLVNVCDVATSLSQLALVYDGKAVIL